MPGDALYADVGTINYIRSEYAFSDAQKRGRWQVLMGRIRGRNSHLLSFHQVVAEPRPIEAAYRGLQDIPLKQIVGSIGRDTEFTRHFFPLTREQRQKERWRTAFALTLSGAGYPPIEVFQVDETYFVINGHHRVSIASYLRWKTIQAHVSEVQLPVERQN
ncbi:MAG: hypothetical protein PVH17_06165 [Anaerolineae bacterium]|jgi:hypothetical protein